MIEAVARNMRRTIYVLRLMFDFVGYLASRTIQTSPLPSITNKRRFESMFLTFMNTDVLPCGSISRQELLTK